MDIRYIQTLLGHESTKITEILVPTLFDRPIQFNYYITLQYVHTTRHCRRVIGIYLPVKIKEINILPSKLLYRFDYRYVVKFKRKIESNKPRLLDQVRKIIRN